MSNPYYRDFFPKWLALHEKRLNRIRSLLPGIAAAARAAEAGAAEAAGREARPLGAVFDIDEILLCNIHLNGYSAPAGVQGPDPIDFHAADFFVDPATKKKWGRDDPCNPPLPGAVALLRAVADLGIKIFFITGRLEHLREETVSNFERVGIDIPPEALRARGADEILTLCPPEKDPRPGESIRPYKEGRRKQIEKTHRIVINVGDQVSDLGLHGDNHFLLGHPFYMIA